MWDFEGCKGLQGGAQDCCQHHRHPLQGFGGGGTVKFVKAVHGGQRRLKKAKTKNVNLCFFLATSLLSLLALPSKATECVCDAGSKNGPLKPKKALLQPPKKGQPASNPSLPRSRFSSSQPWPSQSMASRHRTRSQRPSLAPASVPSPCRPSPTLP